MKRLNKTKWEWEPDGLKIFSRVPLDERPEVEALMKDNRYALYLKRVEKKRSLNANAYMWKLCDGIAKAVRSTKEDVYKRAIRDVGVFDTVCIHALGYDRFKNLWESRGIGWFVDVVTRVDNSVYVHTYYGSSTYTSKEMARLIDWLVDEAQELGIDTMTPRERSLLIGKWKPEV